MKLYIKFISKIAQDVYKHGSALSYATPGSSGFDLRAIDILDTLYGSHTFNLSTSYFTLKPGARCLVRCGFSTKLSSEYEIQVRPRSGLALKNGITVVNTPGTIDSDYRGELGVILLNTSASNFEINLGDRIAQAVVCPVVKADFQFVETLDETDRSSGGFGSSGSN